MMAFTKFLAGGIGLAAMAASAPLAARGLSASQAGRRVAVGLELFSVRAELAKDLPGTVTAVAESVCAMDELCPPNAAKPQAKSAMHFQFA